MSALGATERTAISGGSGADRIEGGSGNDILRGADGNDRLNGGLDDGRLNGGPGNDVITAMGGGADDIVCGPGRDKAYVDRNDSTRNCETLARTRKRILRTPTRP
jgi:Ca2+-binding RTX toxin-like protein